MKQLELFAVLTQAKLGAAPKAEAIDAGAEQFADFLIGSVRADVAPEQPISVDTDVDEADVQIAIDATTGEEDITGLNPDVSVPLLSENPEQSRPPVETSLIALTDKRGAAVEVEAKPQPETVPTVNLVKPQDAPPKAPISSIPPNWPPQQLSDPSPDEKQVRDALSAQTAESAPLRQNGNDRPSVTLNPAIPGGDIDARQSTDVRPISQTEVAAQGRDLRETGAPQKDTANTSPQQPRLQADRLTIDTREDTAPKRDPAGAGLTTERAAAAPVPVVTPAAPEVRTAPTALFAASQVPLTKKVIRFDQDSRLSEIATKQAAARSTSPEHGQYDIEAARGLIERGVTETQTRNAVAVQTIPEVQFNSRADANETLLRVDPLTATSDRPTVQATVATPTATSDQVRQIAQQLLQAMPQQAPGTTDILLQPEELGRVRMTLTVQDGALALAIIAERPETSDLMRRHLDQLVQTYRQMGFDNLSFSFAGSQNQRPQEFGSQHRRLGDIDEPASPPPISDTARPTLSARLDMRM